MGIKLMGWGGDGEIFVGMGLTFTIVSLFSIDGQTLIEWAAGWAPGAPKTRQSHQWRQYNSLHAALWQPCIIERCWRQILSLYSCTKCLYFVFSGLTYFHVGLPHRSLPHFPSLWSTSAFSTPAFSTPAIYSRIFHCRIFNPCIFYRIAFSAPAFSVVPKLHVLRLVDLGLSVTGDCSLLNCC